MKKAAYLSLIFIGMFFLALTLKNLAVFLRPFCLSIIVVFIFTPMLRFLKRKHLPLPLVTITLILVTILFLFLVSFFLIEVVKEGNNLVQEINQQNENIFQTVNDFEIPFTKIRIDLFSILKPEDISKFFLTASTYLLKLVSNIFSEAFLVILFSAFILSYFDKFEKKIKAIFRTKERDKISSTMRHIEKNIKIFLITKSTISFFTALCCYIIFVIFNFKYSLSLSFLIFIFNFIPTFGSIASTFLSILIYGLTQGLDLNFLIFSILLIVVQQIWGNVIEPKLTGDQLRLNPIIILLSLFLLSYIWGPIGMLIAVPITSIIKIILEHLDKTKVIADLME
jgi:predicted PurR-regulated permease PerM